MGVGGQHHAPAALPPVKTRYPLYRRLGWPQGRSGRERKISPPTGIRSPDRPTRSELLYRLSCLIPRSRISLNWHKTTAVTINCTTIILQSITTASFSSSVQFAMFKSSSYFAGRHVILRFTAVYRIQTVKFTQRLSRG